MFPVCIARYKGNYEGVVFLGRDFPNKRRCTTGRCGLQRHYQNNRMKWWQE